MTVLPLLRGYRPYPCRMRRDILGAVFQMRALVRRQVVCHAYARPPFACGPDRARDEAAAAVRADVEQLGLDAIRAERAFIRANPRIHCIRRQVEVAIFAVRSKLQRHREAIDKGNASSQIARLMRMTRFPRCPTGAASRVWARIVIPGRAAASLSSRRKPGPITPGIRCGASWHFESSPNSSPWFGPRICARSTRLSGTTRG